MPDYMIEQLTDAFFSRMRLPEELKNDPEERSNMRMYIISGSEYLSRIAYGADIDYNKDLFAWELLYNRCFYDRADCLDKFETAYQSYLINLRLSYKAKAAKTTEETENAETQKYS